MALGVAEMLAHGAGRVRSDVLHRGGFGGRSGHHDGVLHRAVILQHLHDLRNGRPLLPNGAINTDQVVALIVDDGVERNRGFARLTIADDELALATADWNHAVDRLQTSGHGLTYGLTINHARRQALQRDGFIGADGALVIDRLAKRVHHATDQGIAHGHAHNAARAFYFIAFLDFSVIG